MCKCQNLIHDCFENTFHQKNSFQVLGHHKNTNLLHILGQFIAFFGLVKNELKHDKQKAKNLMHGCYVSKWMKFCYISLKCKMAYNIKFHNSLLVF